MFELFIIVSLVLLLAGRTVERIAARYIDLTKISEQDRKLWDLFQTRVRPSLSNVTPEGRRLVLAMHAVYVAAVLIGLGFVAYFIIESGRPSGPAFERWGVGR